MKKTILNINSIESFSTKDGDGTRCVVFLQGCPLKCVYCHNIETQSAQGGQQIEISELVKKVLRYKAYFGSAGGVTASGGEPLMQAKPLTDFFKLLKNNGINTALDTSGAIFNEEVKNVISQADHIILDLKFNTEEAYKKFCGGSLKTTLEFLSECEKQNKRILVRIVVVPKINSSKAELKKYLQILKGRKIEKIELLPFHTLGFSKYEKLGIKNQLINTKPMCAKKCQKLQQWVDLTWAL